MKLREFPDLKRVSYTRPDQTRSTIQIMANLKLFSKKALLQLARDVLQILFSPILDHGRRAPGFHASLDLR